MTVRMGLLLALTLLLAGCATRGEIPQQYQVFFNFDSAELTEDTRTIVRQAAANAKLSMPARIILAGYTGLGADARTDDRLATQRFVVVEEALVAEGIDRAILSRSALVDPIPLPATAVRRIEIHFAAAPLPGS